MNSQDFLNTLEDLKANRRISSETKALFDPFRGQVFTLKMHYGSSIRTFGNSQDSAYDGGNTVTAKIEDRKIEVSLLLDQSENHQLESLNSGDPMEYKVTVLDFDEFYQRAVLGQVSSESESAKNSENAPQKRAAEPVQESKESKPPPQVEEVAKIPTKTEKRERSGHSNLIRSTDKVERRAIDKPPPQSSESKIVFGGVLLALGGIVAALGAVWGWTNEYPFLPGYKIDSLEHCVFCASLTFLFATGLPCLATRAWKSFLITICAFGFNLTGLYTHFNERENHSQKTEINSVEREVDETSGAESENEKMFEHPGKSYFNTAVFLTALVIIGLAKSVALKKLGSLAVLLAWAHLFYVLILLFRPELSWSLAESFPLLPSCVYLLPIIACCGPILIEGIKTKD
tara:strand:- start:50 stop:1255 length:1206 start_codon:yes stop_codon:yes gene_type:complete